MAGNAEKRATAAGQPKGKFVIAAGGTGGHIFPGLSLYRELVRRDQNVRFLCRRKDLSLIGDLKQIRRDLVLLGGTGLRRSVHVKNLLFVFFILWNTVRVFIFFLRWKPDAVIGMGGYITFPVLLVSFLFKTPFFLHEQNSHPGRVNRMFGRRARKVFINFSYSSRFFPNSRLSGNPVRESVKERIEKGKAFRFFRFPLSRPVLLVMGGSQGSLRINYAVASVFTYLQKFNIIWIAGKTNYPSFRKFEHENVRVLPYLKEMNYAYSIADAAVSRSGAMSITELALYRIPTLFIPLARSADGHQTVNASLLVRAGAAALLEEKDLKSDIFLERINRLYAGRNRVRQNMGRFFIQDSEQMIVREALASLRRKA